MMETLELLDWSGWDVAWNALGLLLFIAFTIMTAYCMFVPEYEYYEEEQL